MGKYIAKHYWKDGEYAVWECDDKIDKNVFSYLKSNYNSFLQKRPVQEIYNGFSILLEYEDTTDIYNRPITNVTFNVSSNKELKKTLFFIGILLSAILGGYSFVSPQKEIPSINTPQPIVQDYTKLKKDWNEKVGENSKFKLQGNSKEIIAQLNRFMSPFKVTFSETMTETDIKKKIKESTKKDTWYEAIKQITNKESI